jgi:hypothetical protein
LKIECKNVWQKSKSCQKVVKICQTFVKIGDNCMSKFVNHLSKLVIIVFQSIVGGDGEGGQKVIPRPLADYLGVGKRQKLQILK